MNGYQEKHKRKNQTTVIPQCKDIIQGTLFLHTYHCMAYSQHNMYTYSIWEIRIILFDLLKGKSKGDTLIITLTYHYKKLVYTAGMKHRDHCHVTKKN
jgi:hypothetical protein